MSICNDEVNVVFSMCVTMHVAWKVAALNPVIYLPPQGVADGNFIAVYTRAVYHDLLGTYMAIDDCAYKEIHV